MSARLDRASIDTQALMRWLPVFIGLAALFVPTWLRLWNGLWSQEEYEHGPLVLMVCLWLVWTKRAELATLTPRPALGAGSALLAAGLFCYFVGRSLNLPLFEVSAQLPIVAGTLLLTLGWRSLRVLWFMLLFMVFLIPLPPFVIVAITSALKERVSMVAEVLMYHAGYPIARDGVILSIGQYRMLVADACSGMNSMYSLSAMGLLYLYLVKRPSVLHNAVMLASILPIAFFANVLRVIALTLITYHFGDEAGQGFLHWAAGIVLFIVALASLFLVDALLVRMLGRRRAAATAAAPTKEGG